MPPWPRIAISVYPQARCLWTSSTWILSAAFVKRSRSTRLRPSVWSSEDQEKKFGTFIKGRLRLAWFRARRALRESPTSKKASDFAKQCGIQAVQTHCGFIPENPNDPVYKETIAASRGGVGYCRNNGQNLRYETGQETPITSCARFRT